MSTRSSSIRSKSAVVLLALSCNLAAVFPTAMAATESGATAVSKSAPPALTNSTAPKSASQFAAAISSQLATQHATQPGASSTNQTPPTVSSSSTSGADQSPQNSDASATSGANQPAASDTTAPANAVQPASPNNAAATNVSTGSAPLTKGTILSGNIASHRLAGSVIENAKKCPLLTGTVQQVPSGTPIELNVCTNINSELSQKGDEILVQVASDVSAGSNVQVPGGWYMHGLVTDSQSQKRLGRDGFVEVEFDKLVSPDGAYELPFTAKFSTKDSMIKSVAKVAAIDSGYVAWGALGGAILSVQLTGISTAVATQGYSVAIGAGVGATLGAIGAAKRKGKIASYYPGDPMKLTLAEPMILPGFDKTAIPSGKVQGYSKDISLTVNKASFRRDPLGDKASNLLDVDLTVGNKTAKKLKFCDLVVASSRNQMYPFSMYTADAQRNKTVKPGGQEAGLITFQVADKKQKYFLVLRDNYRGVEVQRVPLN